jgi:hypothetical protein
MALRTLARMAIATVVLLVSSAFGQTITWPSCPSLPAAYTGFCIDTDLSVKVSVNGTNPQLPAGIDATKLPLAGGTMSGTIVWASGQTFPPDPTKLPLTGGTMSGAITFASGQTFPPPVLPLPYDASGAAFITGPVSVGNGLVPQFTAGTGKLSSSGLQVANVVASTNSVNLPESRITNLTTDLASKQATLPAKSTATVGTTQIAANSCSAASTVSVVGTTTASVINFTPSSDITAVTGWGITGGLVIAAWPTQDAVNYKVCNQSNAAITPSAAVTFNVGAR